jgi:uncharacterized delta-60 repeat protein
VDGSADTSFIANAVDSMFNGTVNKIIVQSDGKILVGGLFTDYNSASGQSHLIRLNSDGTHDTSFNGNILSAFSDVVSDIALQSDGKILVAGFFMNFNATYGVNYLVRLNSDGTEDTTFTANAVTDGFDVYFNGEVRSVTIQQDGKLLLCGQFNSYRQIYLDSLVRLNSDGTLDTTFTVNAITDGASAFFNSVVYSAAVQSDGKIVIVGSFTSYKGVGGRGTVIRLNSDGTEDTAFNDELAVDTNFREADPELVHIDDQGNIYISGAAFDFKNISRSLMIIGPNFKIK